MIVSGASTVYVLESAMNAKGAREEINVEMLDKAQELMRQQGEAMIRVIEDARKPGDPPPFEALA